MPGAKPSYENEFHKTKIFQITFSKVSRLPLCVFTPYRCPRITTKNDLQCYFEVTCFVGMQHFQKAAFSIVVIVYMRIEGQTVQQTL